GAAAVRAAGQGIRAKRVSGQGQAADRGDQGHAGHPRQGHAKRTPAMTLLIVLSLAALGAAQETAPGERGLRDEMSCGTLYIAAPPIGGIRVTSGAVPGRVMFGPGDGFIVNAGTKQGIRNGQMYFVRRY